MTFWQVCGSKYIRLINEDQADLLYIDGDRSIGKQNNVSAVTDIEHPDSRFPLLAEAVFQEAVLQPGELLFIPYKMFHYVRTLPSSASMSVNFWF